MSTDRPSLWARFKYWFDTVMAKGTAALLGFLALITAIFIVINAAIVYFLNQGDGGERESIAEIMWDTFVRTMRSKDVAEGTPWAFRITMLVVTVVGVLIVANLISIINGAFNKKLGQIQKGRSEVLEKGHTLIIGWNSKIEKIVSGLVENAGNRRDVIVILADKDKMAMDDWIREKVGKTGRTKVICRSGDPLDQDDLLLVRPFRAKSVIVLAAEEYPDSDARVTKIALALSRHPVRAGRPLHIVGQITHRKNLEVAKLAGDTDAEWILGREKIGQITAQAALQPGLSAVYSEMLSFAGTEMYFHSAPELKGKKYDVVQASFAKSAVLGIAKEDGVLINPPAETTFDADDQVVLVAENYGSMKVSEPGSANPKNIVKAKRVAKKAEKTLILGSNGTLGNLLTELDAYSAKGSVVTVVSEFAVEAPAGLKNITVKVVKAETSDRDVLDKYNPVKQDHVIVLPYSDDLESRVADTRTLVTLLHLRDIMSRAGTEFNVVSEMLEEKNRRLAEVTKIDDFIVSDHLISLMIAQVSQNPELADVWRGLFSADGAEIYLKPAENYVKTGTPVDFYTVVAAASARGESAIGYLAGNPLTGDPDVVLSPDKSEARKYNLTDRVIVVAED